MKLRFLQFERLVKKIEEGLDYNAIQQLEEAYEIWTWHPGMG